MSISKSITSFGFLPPHSSNSSGARKPISLSISLSSSSSSFLKNHYQNRFWNNIMRSKKYYTSQRRFLVRSSVQPGASPPDPPFNIINWIVGIAATLVIPFFGGKWTSILRIKNEVETAVQIAEDIAEAVEKAAGRVEKAAEHMAEELPKGGGMRKVVDFVEHVAETANRDAHLVGDFIDKVQEVEEKVEDYVESIVHGHHKLDNDQENEEEKDKAQDHEDRAQEPAKEEEEEDHGPVKEEEDNK